MGNRLAHCLEGEVEIVFVFMALELSEQAVGAWYDKKCHKDHWRRFVWDIFHSVFIRSEN
jgi:hypothetical protein